MIRDPAHPRPHLQRPGWRLLDGEWDFALDPDAEIDDPDDVEFDRTIVVPFAPETKASGIEAKALLQRCWYRRSMAVPTLSDGERWVLHFAAVDHDATVWADGHLVAQHRGGWTPFSADLTPTARRAGRGGSVEVIVRADDRPRDAAISRGKQDWQLEPHLIWYPRTTGIWQSVWQEVVPAVHIRRLDWASDPGTLSVTLDLTIEGDVRTQDEVHLELRAADRLLVDEQMSVTDVVDGRATLRRTFGLGTAGFDDAFALIWRPRRPVLLEATLRVEGAAGTDEVASYTAIRSVAVRAGRFELNGKPQVLRFALDQGIWPESGMTAPSLAALRRDVELVLDLGLNGVRKHQKVEDPRWLAMCDELGVLVWEEMPSAFAFSSTTVVAITREWMDVVERDRNHPCIVAWVPVNESWGVPRPVDAAEQASTIRALAHVTSALDPTRPVSANDGWETVAGDIVGIHDYDQDAARLAARYATEAAVDAVFEGRGPGGRRLTIDGSGRAGRAVVVSEMGGCTLDETRDDLFTYGNIDDSEAWVGRYRSLCAATLASDVLSGYCWTQLTDTHQEANGLLRADRTPKVAIERLAAASRGELDPLRD